MEGQVISTFEYIPYGIPNLCNPDIILFPSRSELDAADTVIAIAMKKSLPSPLMSNMAKASFKSATSSSVNFLSAMLMRVCVCVSFYY